MDKEARKRLFDELNAQRFRVVMIRTDGGRNVIAKGLEHREARSIHTKLILENGLSNSQVELDATAPHLKAARADQDTPSESN